jgi:hypothetical protein
LAKEETAMRRVTLATIGALAMFPTSLYAQQPADDAPLLNIVPDCADARKTGDPVVCGRRDPRTQWQLPILNDGFDPQGTIDSVSRERHRLIETGGTTGIGSCTNVGPGGYTGCFFNDIRHMHEQSDGNGPVAIRTGTRDKDEPQ